MATAPGGADQTGRRPASQPGLGVALMGLGVATALAVLLLEPPASDEGFLAGLARLGWFVFVFAPGWVIAVLDLVAGISHLQGRPWGRRVGVIASSATIFGAGWFVLTTATMALAESGERDRTLILFAVLAAMGIVTLAMQLARVKPR